jgi:cell division protein ZapA (FtsZ GTPase activity inhibitor)
LGSPRLGGPKKESQSTRVTILGNEYPIRSDVDDDTMLRIVHYVNQKVQQARETSSSYDRLKIAVLATLNITGELFEYRTKVEALERRLRELEARTDQLTKKIDGAV